MAGRSEDLRTLSDEALVTRVASGDEIALGEFYDRVGQTAYGLALRVLRDEQLAEDAVQEGLLAVCGTLHRSARTERKPAPGHLLSSTVAPSTSFVERSYAAPSPWARRPSLLTAEFPGKPTRSSGFASSGSGSRQRSVSFQTCSGRRSSSPTYGGFSQSELAKRLGVPLGTIKSRMFSGLARLRELLDEPNREESWKPELSEDVSERDGRAWNLPGQELAPVGPVPEAGPATALEAYERDTQPPERPAAA